MIQIAVSFGEIHAEAPKNAQINNSRKEKVNDTKIDFNLICQAIQLRLTHV